MKSFFERILILFFATLIFSCSGLTDDEKQTLDDDAKVSDSAYVNLEIADSARTILPDFETNKSRIQNMILKGKKSGEAERTLKECNGWQSQVAVPTGDWSFTLTIKFENATYVGTTEKTIVPGDNTLSFKLSSSSENEQQTGSFSITLNYDSTKADYGLATIENMDGTSVSGFEQKKITKTYSYLKTEIPEGIYRIKIVFYKRSSKSSEPDIALATYQELVQISGGLKSTAERTIENFENLCTITYELNRGYFRSSVQETFSRRTGLTLPIPYKSYYKFEGWYTDADFSEDSKISKIENIAEDITVYAKWKPIEYKIEYVLNGGKNPSDAVLTCNNVYPVTLPEPTRDYYTFCGWYADEKFQTSISNEICRWYAITLYAKWESNIVRDIKNMTTSGTVVGRGEINSEVLKEIAAAVNNLKDGIKINLDLSKTTGLTNIEDRAFAHCRKLTSITLPDSVTTIGNYAFSDCGFTSVTIPDSVTSIGSYAFNGCSSCTVIINRNITTNSASNFGKILACFNDINVSISDDVTYIDDYAFSGCTGLTSITIPKSVTRIGSYAFDGCSRLTNVTIPDGVTSISKSTFAGCSGLTSIIIPNGVTSIGDNAFKDCAGLTSITIPDGVTSISSSTFAGCSGLTSIIIPNGVTSIGDNAFKDCAGLISITIPDGVTSISSSTFSGCFGLTSITIPDGVTSIGDAAFSGCSGLTSITIPDGVTSIGDAAFSGCSGLASITIPDGVTSIGKSAFSRCSGLTSITIPGGVTSIGEYAFYGCSGLTSITIPNGVKTIAQHAFDGCSKLTNIKIPNGVTKIKMYAFSFCKGLTSITIPDSVNEIENGAFSYCSGLTGITIPNGVSTIEQYTFSDCSGLTSVTVPEGVTEIGSWAFYGCTGLTNITIPESVTKIGAKAFYCCSNENTKIKFSDTQRIWYKTTHYGYTGGESIGSMSTDEASNAERLIRTCVKYYLYKK